MPHNLKRLKIAPKTGNEKFHHDGVLLDFDLLSFWKWSTSDLVSNATRGVLAEFIVARAIGINLDVRNEWDAYDLETDEGIKIEVKSASYVQSWHQNKESVISYNVQKKRVWNSNTNKREGDPTRPADVYVFALLAHKNKETIDPLDMNQWIFFVLPTEVLNQRERSQHSITLRSLEKLCAGAVNFHKLKQAVMDVYRGKRSVSLKLKV